MNAKQVFLILTIFSCFCHLGCSSAKREYMTVSTGKNSSTDSLRKKIAQLDSTLNVQAIVNIKMDSIKKYTFQLGMDSSFFPINSHKIIVWYNQADNVSKRMVMNPLSKKVIDTIETGVATFKIAPSATSNDVILRNNDGKTKVVSYGKYENAIYNLYPLGDTNSVIISSDQEARNLRINNLDNLYYSLNGYNEMAFIAEKDTVSNYYYYIYNNTFYRYVNSVALYQKDTFLYSYDIRSSNNSYGLYFIFKNGIDIDEAQQQGLKAISPFPIRNKIFFSYSRCWNNCEVLYAYNILTGKSKKFILPFNTNGFLFADDGFFIEYTGYIIDKNGVVNDDTLKDRTYAFIKY